MSLLLRPTCFNKQDAKKVETIVQRLSVHFSEQALINIQKCNGLINASFFRDNQREGKALIFRKDDYNEVSL